jgi:hypothetical protein
MTELLFLVSRQRAELVTHLSHEFTGGDVHVLIDRRKAERRVGTADGHLGVARERRTHERRARRTTDHDLRSIGYSIVPLEAPLDLALETAPPASPTAVREVARYLREAFHLATPIPSWDVRREGQGFVLLDQEGRPVHRLLFAKEFLDSYGPQGADRIPRLLDEWKLIQYVEMAGSDLVLVSSYGVRIGGW